jgi:hypothetical protein
MPARTTVRSGGVFADATYKLHRDMEHPPFYRDSAIWTPMPGRETARPSTGTGQKPRHRDPNDLTVVRAGADGN